MIPTNILAIPKHTKCTNCGACCCVIPATIPEINAIRDYIAVNGISPIERSDKTICPFRDEENKKCLVYPVRPIICRLYGVAKGCMQCPNGNSAEIDGECFLPKMDNIQMINFLKW